ncbi:hypothetical protein [Nocardioides bruguierae]|uniref:Lipoprotein n=1 Tax=Nocardioides bruguierae TaxID=2945102 RepID=A0A9X2DA24_9ACTN|nr:hypothetical protein [Nocardioides bruguierae]MCL8024594.1 hypothetical protein [Nocardioides bruguierae]MCM0620789.1 hypothetical protein [Nocardioides bruguierae]
MKTLTRPGRRTGAAAAIVTLALVAAACGDGDSDTAASPDATVTVTAAASSDDSDTTGGDATTEQRFFNDASVWNTRADDLAVDPRSDRMLSLAMTRIGWEEKRNGQFVRVVNEVTDPLWINTVEWTVPVVAGGTPTEVTCRQKTCGDGDDTITLDIPEDVDPYPEYDGWYTILDTQNSVAYDLWRARREDDGSISYHYMKKWNLDGSGWQTAGEVSARGSGLPLFAGLIRPAELETGTIDHALAIAVPAPSSDFYVSPASSTDGNGRAASLPIGARIRLKGDVTFRAPRDADGNRITLTADQKRYADALVLALRTYGAIVVERAEVPTLYAQRDVTADLLTGQELQGLTLDDFEVTTVGKKYRYPTPEKVAESAAGTEGATASATADASTTESAGSN